MRVLLLGLLCQLLLLAGDRPLFAFYLENDTMVGTDRYYTGGIKFSYLSADLNAYREDGWQGRIISRMPFLNDEGFVKNIGFAAGQQIYTPADTSRSDLIENDRPYAGWSYIAYSFVSRDRETMHTLETRIGLIGPASGAEAMQTGIHEAIGSKEVNGWDHQLNNEVGFNLYYERRLRLEPVKLGDWKLETIPHMGGALGNVHAHVSAGAIARLGARLPADFGPSLIAMSAEPSAPLENGSGRQIAGYFFAGLGAKVIGRDIFLDGNTFSESHSVEKYPYQTTLGLGYSQQIESWRITYAQILNSKEFKGQQDPAWFGSLMIARTF